MQAEVFTPIPNELKTIEIDVEKKIFNVNGVPFGRDCTYFSITCEAGKGFLVMADIETQVHFSERFDMQGNKKTDHVQRT